jgi:hypothetical protein
LLLVDAGPFTNPTGLGQFGGPCDVDAQYIRAGIAPANRRTTCSRAWSVVRGSRLSLIVYFP